MPHLVRIPNREFCRKVDMAFASLRNGPALDADAKRRLRGAAKAADDLEAGRTRGAVYVTPGLAAWLQQFDLPPVDGPSKPLPVSAAASAGDTESSTPGLTPPELQGENEL
jgi:hypothetical protein